MIKYFYNPLDRMVVCSDGRTFTVASGGSLVKNKEIFFTCESDVPCKSSTEAFGMLIDKYAELLDEELEYKRRELVVFENEQLKSINRLRKEVRKYERNIL